MQHRATFAISWSEFSLVFYNELHGRIEWRWSRKANMNRDFMWLERIVIAEAISTNIALEVVDTGMRRQVSF